MREGRDELSDEDLAEIGKMVRLPENSISAKLVDTFFNDGIVDATHHNDPAGPQSARAVLDPLKHLESVRSRHQKVDQDDGRPALVHESQARIAIGGRNHV